MVYLYGRGREGEISDLLVRTWRRRRDQWFTCTDVAEKERSVVYLYGRGGEGEISGLLVRTWRRRRYQWFTCTDDNVRSMYESTLRNDDVDRDTRPEPRIFMYSDRAFMMQLTTLVTYEWRPVVTLIETDEKMSPSPVQALYAKLRILLLCMCDNMRFTQSGMYIISTTVETVLRIYGQALRRNISPGRVFHDILHASKSAIDRNVNSVLSRKWLMDVRTSMAQRGNDYNALPEDVLDHSSHDATYENRYDAAAMNGDAAAKNGDAAAMNGDAAAKNGDAAAKNGDAITVASGRERIASACIVRNW